MDTQSDLNSKPISSLRLKSISPSNQKKIYERLAGLAMDVLLDVAMNNLSDADLSFWLELSNKYGEDSSEPVDFLKSKIPNFDKLYQDTLKKELNTINSK